MKLNYGRTFVLGFGFFAISLSWALYNSFVPVFLDTLLSDASYKGFAIGAIMTFDNIAAITLQPYFGARSDKTWNRFGRRMPYILLGMPLGAGFLALVPVFRHSLPSMVAALVAMNVSMAVFRAPTVALMPDITPPPLRSKANGVINLMGGLGALLAFFVGSRLYDENPGLPFYFAALAMVAVTILLRFTILEPKEVEGAGDSTESVGVLEALREVAKDPDRSAMAMLTAVFFWFVAWSGIEAFFTLYGKAVWGVPESAGARYLGYFSLALVIFAIPAGFIATRAGRRRTIMGGIIGLTLALVLLGFVGYDTLGYSIIATCSRLFGGTASSSGHPAFADALMAKAPQIVPALLVFAGISWAMININSYPMVVDMASRSRTGAYTGLYYLFSSLAAIVGPPLFGFLRDVFGMRSMFPFSVLCAIAAYVFIRQVKRGDPAVSQNGEQVL